MGYDLHITRKAQWSDEEGPTIGLDEWLRVIEEDLELSLDQDTQCSCGDDDVVLAAWKGDPGLLGWFNGEISVKDPDRSLILKMAEIAKRLEAKVQGDDGEEYPEALTRDDVQRKGRWWPRLFQGVVWRKPE